MTEEELKEKARQERNRYYREYRAKNKERVKAATARSWAKKAVERENNMPRKTDITKKERYFDPFPSMLRDLMKANHTNQTKIAEILNLKSRQSVTGYIDGSTLPTIDKVIALAEYYHVSADFLLGIKDVQSTTAVLQAACEYTGLTEQAEKITQHDPKEQNNRAADDIELLKQACFYFALRVLKGENVQPQETAVLPEVLSFLERN